MLLFSFHLVYSCARFVHVCSYIPLRMLTWFNLCMCIEWCAVCTKNMQRLNEWDNQTVRTIAIKSWNNNVGGVCADGYTCCWWLLAVVRWLLHISCCCFLPFHRCDLVLVLSMFVRIYYYFWWRDSTCVCVLHDVQFNLDDRALFCIPLAALYKERS